MYSFLVLLLRSYYLVVFNNVKLLRMAPRTVSPVMEYEGWEKRREYLVYLSRFSNEETVLTRNVSWE